MSRPTKVTLRLREDDARWLLEALGPSALVTMRMAPIRILDELKHALADCDCGEEER